MTGRDDLDREGEKRWADTFDAFADPVVRRGGAAAKRMRDEAILDHLDGLLEEPICDVDDCLQLASLALLCKPEQNHVIRFLCRPHREVVVAQELVRCPSCDLVGPPQLLFRWRVVFAERIRA